MFFVSYCASKDGKLFNKRIPDSVIKCICFGLSSNWELFKPINKVIHISERHALRVFKSFRHKAIHSQNGRVNYCLRTKPVKKRLNLVYSVKTFLKSHINTSAFSIHFLFLFLLKIFRKYLKPVFNGLMLERCV